MNDEIIKTLKNTAYSTVARIFAVLEKIDSLPKDATSASLVFNVNEKLSKLEKDLCMVEFHISVTKNSIASVAKSDIVNTCGEERPYER